MQFFGLQERKGAVFWFARENGCSFLVCKRGRVQFFGLQERTGAVSRFVREDTDAVYFIGVGGDVQEHILVGVVWRLQQIREIICK